MTVEVKVNNTWIVEIIQNVQLMIDGYLLHMTRITLVIKIRFSIIHKFEYFYHNRVE